MSYDPDPIEPAPPPARGPRVVEGVLAALLAMSLVGNVVLYRKPARVVERPSPPVAVVPPMAPTCPECPACAVCPPAPPPCPEVAAAPTGTGTPRGPAPPREDPVLAQQGEGHIATAAEHGERDPVHRAAQRNVVTGLDNIVTSRSAPAAERFIQRTLPSVASMDCAFRDAAMAEHVRMQLRPLNALARPAVRLSEADLVRYERDLRCPRE